MRIRIIAVVILLAAGGIFAFTRLTGSGSESDSGGAAADSADVRRIPIGVAILQSGQVEDAVTAWGTVSPFQQAAMLSELSGRVAAVHVSLGSTQAVCELKTTRPREHVCEQLHHVLLHTLSRHSRR